MALCKMNPIRPFPCFPYAILLHFRCDLLRMVVVLTLAHKNNPDDGPKEDEGFGSLVRSAVECLWLLLFRILPLFYLFIFECEGLESPM